MFGSMKLNLCGFSCDVLVGSFSSTFPWLVPRRMVIKCTKHHLLWNSNQHLIWILSESTLHCKSGWVSCVSKSHFHYESNICINVCLFSFFIQDNMQLHAYMASYAKLALFMEHAMFFALNILIHFNIDISMKGDIELFFFFLFHVRKSIFRRRGEKNMSLGIKIKSQVGRNIVLPTHIYKCR